MVTNEYESTIREEMNQHFHGVLGDFAQQRHYEATMG